MPTRFQLANAIRALSKDAVEQAQSGHPGMPLGMADIAEVLWNDFLRHNPSDPHWVNRDRFILSNGHGSMLQYALLHLTGYDVSIDDLKSFRQLHSKTPGHPEVAITPGVETSTGPLGQGLANGVGMALAERLLAQTFNKPGHTLIDHHTYVFLGDGCLMEGISHEAASLAGTLGLNKLICVWDDNGISIDGKVDGWFTDDTPKRFEAYGWHVIKGVDGHDPQAIYQAFEKARAETARPTLIDCKTIIGFGAPTIAGTAKSHGAPLGPKEIELMRKKIDWPYDEFVIPDDIYQAWNAKEKGINWQIEWNKRWEAYQTDYPELAYEFSRRVHNVLPEQWYDNIDKLINNLQHHPEKIATRQASHKIINELVKLLPELIGGSADLTGSNLTKASDATIVTSKTPGNYIYYGVREFGMSAIMNGLALYGGFIPFGGTFLTFLDYARNAVRMSALMKQRVIYVYTHDSIGLGEDGPTHQPIEHLSMLRLTPNMSVWRPCDQVEAAVAWKAAIERMDGPTSLTFSRQALVCQPRDAAQVDAIRRGGYILKDSETTPELILIATGSEVELAMEAAQRLSDIYQVRVVSLPSTDTFEKQSDNYQESVLPKHIKYRIVIEAGATGLWWRYAGDKGRVIGVDQFGESAPYKTLYNYFGITVENIIKQAKALLAE